MATYAFYLAAAAALAAAVLWYFDARQRKAQMEPLDPTEIPTTSAQSVSSPEPEPAETEVKAENPEPEVALEPEPDIEAETAQPPPLKEPPIASEPEVAAETEPASPPDPTPATARQRGGISFPGALRRERRTWAEAEGYEFSRSDDYLNDEWARGAAASGAPAKDIVSGQAYGHEMVLMDLGGVNVMAMRRGEASEIVVDCRRGEFPEHNASEDMLEALSTSGFTIFATDTAVAQRFVDERVNIALVQMPEIVTAVWMEEDWVLAQTARGSHAADWTKMLAPLALLADAARALPPKSSSAQVLNLDGLDPSRQMPAPGLVAAKAFGLSSGIIDGGEPPLVQRPEEPLDLPTRVLPVARGVVEPREVGTDEVDAIGEAGRSRTEDGQGTRMPRDLSGGSSIFDDPSG
ncbi:hypothetical protein [Corynebacterium alimapuense]|uniref:Uncharacterized protein n=1 Tax=Corynebacterium alimapuense TaxID=1576874 RepID=A0A3M8K9N1_9CORY|nr:hypothetical protein [Corynebacterium alimapuense]RNE49933.1 hypothetical protein C5L39_00730 [Corynebacterium alimapuense]